MDSAQYGRFSVSNSETKSVAPFLVEKNPNQIDKQNILVSKLLYKEYTSNMFNLDFKQMLKKAIEEQDRATFKKIQKFDFFFFKLNSEELKFKQNFPAQRKTDFFSF
jgi:hypothetical protein